MQPYPNYPNYGYQPQYGNYQPYNPIVPYQDRLAQLQNQYNQQPAFNQISQNNQTLGLNGEIVDGIDVVKAKNVDMSGNVTFYPKSDMSEIYTKQLRPDGTSKITVYKAAETENNQATSQNQTVTLEIMNEMLSQLKNDLLQEIGTELSRIKDMIPPISQNESPKNQRGGSQR